ncbi:unnamed protein product [Amoebophrya sp. A120]|nr:unnamed protein product [Amoebophrya sp. A120]|eukprot:GSA120T00021557001.1
MIFRGSWVLVLLAAVRSGLSASGPSSTSIRSGREPEPAASPLRGDGPTYTHAQGAPAAGSASDGPDSDSEGGSEFWDSSGSSGSESSSENSRTGGGAAARAGGNDRGRRRTVKKRTRTSRKRSSSSSSSSSRNKSRTQEDRGSASRSAAAGSSGPSSDLVLREPAREQSTSGRRQDLLTRNSPDHDEQHQDNFPDEQQGSCSICLEDAANLGPENALMQPPTQMRCQCKEGMCHECLCDVLMTGAYNNMLARPYTPRTVVEGRNGFYRGYNGSILCHRLSYDEALKCTACSKKYTAVALHALLRQWTLRLVAKNWKKQGRPWILAPELLPETVEGEPERSLRETVESNLEELVARHRRGPSDVRPPGVVYMDNVFNAQEVEKYWQSADARFRLNERWISWYQNLSLVAAGYALKGGGENIYFFETEMANGNGATAPAARAEFESWRQTEPPQPAGRSESRRRPKKTPDVQAPDARQQFMADLLLQRDNKFGKTLLLDAMDTHLETRVGTIYHSQSAESASRLDFVWQLAVTFLTPDQMRKLLLTRARDGRTVLHAAAQLATHEVALDFRPLEKVVPELVRFALLAMPLQLRLIATWLSVKEQRTLLFQTHTQVSSSGVLTGDIEDARGRGEPDLRYSAWVNSARYSEKHRTLPHRGAIVPAPYRHSGEEAGSVILQVLDESCAAPARFATGGPPTTDAATESRSGSARRESSGLVRRVRRSAAALVGRGSKPQKPVTPPAAPAQRTGVALEKCRAKNEDALLYARTEGASRLHVIRLAAPSTVEWVLQKVRADDRKVVRKREMKRFKRHFERRDTGHGPGDPSLEDLQNCLDEHRLCRQFAFLLHAAESAGSPGEPFYRGAGLESSTRLRVLLHLVGYNDGLTDATSLTSDDHLARLQHAYDAVRGRFEQDARNPFGLQDSGSGSARALLWVWRTLLRKTPEFRDIRHTIWESYAGATIPMDAHQITSWSTREEELELLKRDVGTKLRLGEESADPAVADLEQCLELYLLCHKFAFLLHHTDSASTGVTPVHYAAGRGDWRAVETVIQVRPGGSSEGEQNAGAVGALFWVWEKLLMAEWQREVGNNVIHTVTRLPGGIETITTRYEMNADRLEELADLLHVTVVRAGRSGDLPQLERAILYTKVHEDGDISVLHSAGGARLDWFLERIRLDRQGVVATTEMEHFNKGSYLQKSDAPKRKDLDACLKTNGRCRQFAFLLHAVDANGNTALHEAVAVADLDLSKAEKLIGRQHLNFIRNAAGQTVNTLKPFGDPGKDYSNNDRALQWIWKLLLNKPNNEGRAAKDVFASASDAWYAENGQHAVSFAIGKLRKMFRELQPMLMTLSGRGESISSASK